MNANSILHYRDEEVEGEGGGSTGSGAGKGGSNSGAGAAGETQVSVGSNPFLTPPSGTGTQYKKGYIMRKCCTDPNGKKSMSPSLYEWYSTVYSI